MVFHLVAEKLNKLLGLIEGFCLVSKVSLCQMPSLLELSVCRIMPMGRVFSQRLSLMTRGVASMEHRINLTRTLKADF